MGEDDGEKNDAKNESILRRSLFEESDLLFSQQPSTLRRLASNPNPSPPGVTTFTTASKKTERSGNFKKVIKTLSAIQESQNALLHKFESETSK